jgi:cell wall-associated NlpC family hydrolase
VALSALPAPSAVIASAPLINDALAQSYESLQPVLRSEPPPPPAVASGSDLVDTARRYRGVRYRWAGMSSRGMDCSGLIARVLRANGVRAPHNAAQLFKLGETVRFRDLQPGDLLFFKTSRRGISHVGMYVGEDKFIHASSGAGRVVTTSIYDPYYSKRLKGARRLGETSE